MTFDFRAALKRVNEAIGHILQPGPFGAGIQNAVSEVASLDLMNLPSAETREALDHIFVAAKAFRSRTPSEEEAEELARLIFALRSSLEMERKAASEAALAKELVGTVPRSR